MVGKENTQPQLPKLTPRRALAGLIIILMVAPLAIFDVCVTLYNRTVFPLYKIPYVKRKDYFVFEREHMNYLTRRQKIYCFYCSYANGLMAYSLEIAGRTERYWCPLKHGRKAAMTHRWYEGFAELGDEDGWQKKRLDPKQLSDS